MLHLDRWQALSQRLAIPADITTFHQLQAAYQEPHRAYHTSEHLCHCLSLLDRHRGIADHPEEVELALWFHDAVYHPQATDNERQSADWVLQYLQQQRASSLIGQRISQMILATADHAQAIAPDTQLLLDIDLAILGQDAEHFDRYDCAIRQEYAWVPLAHYRRRRRAVLLSFLEKPTIYQTTAFQQRYETTARQNLRRAVRRLEANL